MPPSETRLTVQLNRRPDEEGGPEHDWTKAEQISESGWLRRMNRVGDPAILVVGRPALELTTERKWLADEHALKQLHSSTVSWNPMPAWKKRAGTGVGGLME